VLADASAGSDAARPCPSRAESCGRTGEGASIISVLGQDDALTILGRRFDNSWLQVRSAAGTVGWVYAPLLTVNIPLTNVPVIDAQFIAPPTPMPTPIPALPTATTSGLRRCTSLLPPTGATIPQQLRRCLT